MATKSRNNWLRARSKSCDPFTLTAGGGGAIALPDFAGLT
jgi:hypothetical protein